MDSIGGKVKKGVVGRKGGGLKKKLVFWFVKVGL